MIASCSPKAAITTDFPDDHKRLLLEGLRMVDEVIVTQGHDEGLDFKEDFLRIRPAMLLVTEDVRG